jgi:hypothetical protein
LPNCAHYAALQKEKEPESGQLPAFNCSKISQRVSVCEQSLGKLGDHAAGAYQHDGAPEINPGRPQAVSGPDKAE